MQINVTPYQSCNQNKNTFTSISNRYHNLASDFAKDHRIYTKTDLLRTCLPVVKLVEYAEENFKNKDKVNIHCFAGSDGSEAYSLGIGILELASKEFREKALPIISSDRYKKVIDMALQGRINLCQYDLEKLQTIIKPKHQYFIDPQKSTFIENSTYNLDAYKSYEVVQELRNAVEFKTEDLVPAIKELKDDGNSIIACRNVMPYLREAHRSDVAYYAAKNLKEGSLFLIGEFDLHTDIEKYLYYYGFEKVMDYVFRHP